MAIDKARPQQQLALLSCCGHVGECGLVSRQASEQVCHEFPTCKAPARPSCVINVSELGTDTAAGSDGSVGVKLASVVNLVKRIPGDERILVFVQFPDLLEKVADALVAAKVAAVQLVGSPQKRSSIIEAFQCEALKPNEPRVLLLNLRDESAAGANLTAANHAIFVHPLLVSSQVDFDSCDTQAIGRIRRYGQRKCVQIYRYFCIGTIDADIFQQRFKNADALLETAAPADVAAPLV